MSLLALNTVLPQSMRVKYQLALGVFPLGLMFASFLPLFRLVPWLEAVSGTPANGPIRDQPNGALWFVAFLAVMVLLMLLGYALGWVINALVARFLFNWSTEKIKSVFLQSDVPPHWLKAGAVVGQSADAASIAVWEEQRKGGRTRYIIKRGVVAWGTPMFLAMYVVPMLAKGRASSASDLLLNLAIWALGGAAFGAVIWYSSEANYRRLKERK